MVGRRDSGGLAAVLTRHRWSALIAVGVVAVAISAAAVIGARHNSVAGTSAANLVPVSALSHRPFFLFRSTALNRDYGTVELAPLSNDDDEQAMTSLKCERVAYGGVEVSASTSVRAACSAPPGRSSSMIGSGRASSFPFRDIPVGRRCLAMASTAPRPTS